MFLHLRRERSNSLLRRFKEHVQRLQNGRLPCEVCGFEFGDVYGELGHGFAEAHHTKPLGTLTDGERITTLDDLAIVCANCHRMLHADPYPSIRELQRRLRRVPRAR